MIYKETIRHNFYNKHKDDKLDPIAVENRIQELLQDYDNDYGVTNPNGIYEYILTGKESCLQIRAFRQQEKQQASFLKSVPY